MLNDFIKAFICVLILSYTQQSLAAETYSQRLALINERKTLIVGVKTDYPPWGFYDESGNIAGFEIDLARDIAKTLNVDLALKPVTVSNRITLLESGSIDLIIATMADTEIRQKRTGVIHPYYYASGVTLITRDDNEYKPSSWTDLHLDKICLTKNTYFNREIIDRFLIRPKYLESSRDILSALKTNQCDGWIYDNTASHSLISAISEDALSTPLPTIMLNPWVMAVRKTEENSEFAMLISDKIIDWHRSGKILDLEKKWGISQSAFLQHAQNLWSKNDAQGNPICHRTPTKNRFGKLEHLNIFTPETCTQLAQEPRENILYRAIRPALRSVYGLLFNY